MARIGCMVGSFLVIEVLGVAFGQFGSRVVLMVELMLNSEVVADTSISA